jgi:predicted nucleotidyltransferase
MVQLAEDNSRSCQGLKNSMEQQLNELVNWARGQPEILALYLYGSLAEGRADSLSDVDVGILVKLDISMRRLWELEDHWLARWPEHIDLRVLNSAPLSFRYEVTACGQRLWAADVGTVADIESLIWRQYWDFRPKLEQDWGYYVE